ncbi:DUF3307 domain-containing protein [Aliiruegeria sabulilitoris]|uniref:DUF3307 domain-containing protein n=1 Tax=Aliiruegeria sabulilitoris TaxID=1510458 RepID=UPI0008298BE5|nr:DUF3307 domain-containing protein [Aliiruegeria sabulilitoris]NDR59570.1 DUF3307 domain-containing protein [Pseudoruegeria sp. M32A2M]
MQELLFLLALQIKQLFADFYLQNGFMLSARSRYLHPGRALHCLVHILGTALVLLVFGIGPSALALILIGEFVVHYHIDWGKGRVLAERNLTSADAGYWHAIGVDQALHQASYIVIAAIWLLVPTAG